MSLGYDPELNVFNLNDTAELRAALFDREDQPYAASDLASVSFRIQKPDETESTTAGTIDTDGVGTLNYTDTDLIGQYITIATFTLGSGVIKSTRADFEVVDPMKDADPSASYIVAIEAWHRFEDCFDAEDEGPWLQDVTRNYFNKDKMESFIDDALFDINQQNPPTTQGIVDFVPLIAGVLTPNADLPLLALGVEVQIIRHLIRSYVEQPLPTGAQIAWQDRRDYLQRWQQVLQMEEQQYMRWLALYKRRFLGLGQVKGIVSAKAGRLIGAPMRTRFVGRGYW